MSFDDNFSKNKIFLRMFFDNKANMKLSFLPKNIRETEMNFDLIKMNFDSIFDSILITFA